MLEKRVVFRSMPLEFRQALWTVTILVGLAPGLVRSQEEVLVENGDAWKYMKGTEAPPTDWASTSFIDTGWLDGTTGIGYGDGDDATDLTDMMNGYMAFFARRTFVVSDLSIISKLVLEIDYDDGFVAYLNGVEIARRGLGTAPAPVTFDMAAMPGHEAVAGGGTVVFIDVSAGLIDLVQGPNVLAIELHNTTLNSSDATLRPRLIANGSLPPTNLTCARVLGSVNLAWTNSQVYDSIEVTRNGFTIDTIAGDQALYTDIAPGTMDNLYQVIGRVSTSSYPSINTCLVGCTASTLTCQLSLAGTTQANVSWTPIPNVTSVEVIREGTLVATLTAGETSYFDPNVEDLEAEADTDFTIEQTDASGATCTTNCNMSLCPLTFTGSVVGNQVVLSWGNLVKAWDHFEISRNGTVIDATIPGNATTYTDTTVVLNIGSSYDYLLHPIPVPGGEFGPPMDQCDVAFTLAHVPEVASYNPPAGGWDYRIDFAPGNTLYNPNPGETGNLDGQWIRSIDRDLWDGSDAADADVVAPDGPAPGGLDIVTRPALGACGTSISALRILDPGDTSMPIGTTFPVPFTAPNNSRIVLGLDLGVIDRNVLKSGITLSTRLRTSPDAPAYMNPNPASGDGNPLATGIGHVGVYYRADPALPSEGATAGAAIALQSGGNGGDLELSSNPDSDIDAVGASKFIAVWMTVQGGAAPDTYDVNVYVNGATTPSDEFAGPGAALQGGVADFGPTVTNYIAIGTNSTGDDAMIEIEHVAYKIGVFPPSVTPCGGGGTGELRKPGDFDSSGTLDINDPVATLNHLFSGGGGPPCGDGTVADPANLALLDTDGNGSLNISDPVAWLNYLFTGGPAPANCTDEFCPCIRIEGCAVEACSAF